MTENLSDIEDIIAQLKACDDAYFNGGESSLRDSEYDALKRKAFLTDPANEYFIQIGSDVRGGKIKLPYSMGSLNQVYTGEIAAWVSKHNLMDADTVITDKLDGVSCMLVYNNENFSIAYSRGNGIEGADITRHVKNIPSVPSKIPGVEYLVVRAEIIMANKTFAQKYTDEFKNPRNMVAGAMNRKDTDASILKNLSLVAYEIVAGTVNGQANIEKNLKSVTLNNLKTFGFDVANTQIMKGSELNDIALSNLLRTARGASEYELDGLVITVDAHATVGGTTTSSLNPEHSVKYKVLDADDVVDAVVKDVHWEVSKSGFIKPRVEIFPVELFGTTVKFATGFNAKFIIDNGIGPSAKIKLTKAGMVIPQILSVVKKSSLLALNDRTKYDEWHASKIKTLIGDATWGWNDTAVDIVIADHMNNELVVFKQVLDFFQTYDVELLKEATLSHVWKMLPDKSYDEAICDICDLSESEWVKIVGINGSKIYSSLHRRIGNSSLDLFLGACRYMGVGFGVRKAKLLTERVESVEDMGTLSLDSIVNIDGFDTKTATMVMNGISSTQKLAKRLIDMGVLVFVHQQKTAELSGTVVVMTGFRDADLHARIESMGGKVVSGVSKKTTHLLCIDSNSNSSKMQKARSFGVHVMTPDEFKLAFNL